LIQLLPFGLISELFIPEKATGKELALDLPISSGDGSGGVNILNSEQPFALIFTGIEPAPEGSN
jgi:hypothetical protein